MRHTLKKILLVGATISASPFLTAQDAFRNTYWERYGDEPVYIEQINNNRKEMLKFIDFADGMLVAELDGGTGEISLPVSESMVKTLELDNTYFSAVRGLLDQQNYGLALELLRPKAYPLIKFHEIPEQLTPLHTSIRALIDTLVNAGEYVEARDLLSRIALDKVSVEYSQSAIRLMNAFFLSGESEAGADVAQSLPVEGIYASNIRSILDAADRLRAEGFFEEVIPLYRTIQEVVEGDARVNARMWLAYCLVLANRMEEANEIINSLEEPPITDQFFSLYKLLQGSREHNQGQYRTALDLLTRGFVRAQASYDWVPEMLYRIGDCYARTEEPTAARNVWTEIAILYPQSPWASRAESSLANIQEPEQPAK